MEHDLLPPIQEPLMIQEPTPAGLIPPAPRPAPIFSKNLRRFYLGILLTIVVVFAVVGTVAVYAQALSGGLAARVASAVPFPAAFVSGRPVWLGDFVTEYVGMKKYSDQNATQLLTDEDYQVLRKNVLDALVRKTIVSRMALDNGVYLTKEAVSAQEGSMVSAETTSEELSADVERLFGWNIEMFRDHIVRPAALEAMLNSHLAKDVALQQAPRQEIEGAIARLERGEAFADVAKSVNASNGMLSDDGALGKISLDSIPLTISGPISKLKVGEHTPIIETDLQGDWAFYVVRLNGSEEKDGATVVDLSVIRVKRTMLDDLVGWQLEKAFIWRIVS